MLWDLYGVKAQQYFNTWNTCVKLCWDIPRATHTYFIDNFLAKDFKSFSTTIKTRYVKFFRSLRKSKSEEVRVLSELVGRDMGPTTGKNIAMLERETGLSPWTELPVKFSQKLAALKTQIPEQDLWRLEFLSKLLSERYNLSKQLIDTKYVSSLINSLCIN